MFNFTSPVTPGDLSQPIDVIAFGDMGTYMCDVSCTYLWLCFCVLVNVGVFVLCLYGAPCSISLQHVPAGDDYQHLDVFAFGDMGT